MIKLEPASLERAPDIAAAVQESLSELQQWFPWAEENYSVESAVYWAEKIAPDGHVFLIVNSSGKYLGTVGINSIDEENKTGSIGYWVRSSAAGSGVATAGVRELISWVRNNCDINRMEIVAAVGNVASRRVAEKSGACFEGIAKSRLLIHDEYHDAAVYSHTKRRSFM